MTNEQVSGMPADLIELCLHELQMGRIVRLRDVEDVLELTRYLADEGVMTISMTDDSITTIRPVILN